eukprot:scaffold10099_cov66-Phaeocystis_antarctica.AAC.1
MEGGSGWGAARESTAVARVGRRPAIPMAVGVRPSPRAEAEHGHHLGRVHKQRLLARLGKVDEPQRVAHVDQDVAAVEVAMLLDQAHEGLARVFVTPHSRVAVVDQAMLEYLCSLVLAVDLCEPAGSRVEHRVDATVQQQRRLVTLCQIRALCTFRHAEGEDERSDDAPQGTFDEPVRLCCGSLRALVGLESKSAQRPTCSPQLLHHSHNVEISSVPSIPANSGITQHAPAMSSTTQPKSFSVLAPASIGSPDVSTRYGPRCTCAALAPTNFVNLVVLATSSSMDFASSSLVTVGSSQLPSRSYESVLSTSEPEKPPCSLVATMREQPVKARSSSLTCGTV